MQIPRGRILVCLTRADILDEAACLKVLSADEQARAHAFRFEADRRLSIAARAQIRHLLSELTGVPPLSVSLVRGAGGKPEVRPGTPGDQFSFSLSHTGGMVVSALSQGLPLGIDLEMEDRRADLDIAGRFFLPQEAAQIMGAPQGERSALFLRFWTLKEAWLKAKGPGLSLGLDRIAFDLSAPGRIRWFSAGGTEQRPWQFFQFSPAPGAVAALAAEAREPMKMAAFHCIPFQGLRPAKFQTIAFGC